MGFVDRFRTAYSALKGDLSGRQAPYPQLSYPSFPIDLSQLIALQTNATRTIDPVEANNGKDNAIVQIALMWMRTSMPSAVPMVGVMNGKDFVPDATRHPFLDILEQPDENTDGNWLRAAVNDNWWTRGNGYIHCVRGRGGLVGMDWLPAKYVRPLPNALGKLECFEYTPLGRRYLVDPFDILHFKAGIDEDMPLQGVAPIGPIYREIVTDNAASDYAAGLAKTGTPEIMFTPKPVVNKDGNLIGTMSPDIAKAMMKDLGEKMRREPGKPRMMGGALDMHRMGIEPDKMALTEVRREPETRIAAIFGIPPIVLSLAAGLDKATYANYETAVRYAWQGCMIPTLGYYASVYTVGLRRFYRDAAEQKKVVRFDTTGVPELQQDMAELRDAARKDLGGGIITLEEARAEGGRSTDPQIIAELEEQAAAKLVTGQLVPLQGAAGPGDETVTVAGKTYRISAAILAAIKKKPLATR